MTQLPSHMKRTVWRGTHSATVKYTPYPLDDDGADARVAVGPGWVLIAVDGEGRVYHFNRKADA